MIAVAGWTWLLAIWCLSRPVEGRNRGPKHWCPDAGSRPTAQGESSPEGQWSRSGAHGLWGRGNLALDFFAGIDTARNRDRLRELLAQAAVADARAAAALRDLVQQETAHGPVPAKAAARPAGYLVTIWPQGHDCP